MKIPKSLSSVSFLPTSIDGEPERDRDPMTQGAIL